MKAAFLEGFESHAPTAAGVEDSHAGHDVAAKKLVEEVDVDRAELLLEGGHGFKRMIQDRGSSIFNGGQTSQKTDPHG